MIEIERLLGLPEDSLALPATRREEELTKEVEVARPEQPPPPVPTPDQGDTTSFVKDARAKAKPPRPR